MRVNGCRPVIRADVCGQEWLNDAAPVSPLPMQHSTRAHARAASTVCEGARDGQTSPFQCQTALQVPPTPGEAWVATGHSEGSLPSAVLRSSVVHWVSGELDFIQG